MSSLYRSVPCPYTIQYSGLCCYCENGNTINVIVVLYVCIHMQSTPCYDYNYSQVLNNWCTMYLRIVCSVYIYINFIALYQKPSPKDKMSSWLYCIWGFFMPLNFHEFHELFWICEIKFLKCRNVIAEML